MSMPTKLVSANRASQQMDRKSLPFERIEGRKPRLDDEDLQSLGREGISIREADRRDGTNAFLEAAFSDAISDEPDYTW